MAVLFNRIQFTEMVDGAMPGNLVSVQTALQAKRGEVIKALRTQLSSDQRRQLNVLQTLFKEQLDVVGDLLTHDDASSVWKDEFRFYARSDGAVVCRCAGHDVLVGDCFQPVEMLVVTPLTRQARKKIMEALQLGKIFFAFGPPGTGKTETVKDTMRLLGREASIVNCSDQMTAVPLEAIAEALKNGGKSCAVCYDEFNRIMDQDTMVRIANATEAETFTCVTMNPDFTGRTEVPEEIKSKCVIQEMTVPNYEIICQVMLGREGIVDCDALGSKLFACSEACKETCSKQCYYDFGLRWLRATCRSIGARGREAGYDDETRMCAEVLLQMLHVRASAADKDIIKAEVKAAFAVDVEVPASWSSGTAEGLANRVDAVAKQRHGVCVVGVPEGDVDAAVAAVGSKMGAENIVVAGDAAGLYGDGDSGAFTQAFKAAMTKDSPVNIVLKMPMDSKSMEPLNTLLDDNKVFCPPSGGRLNMSPNMRIIFFMADCSKWSPASVSRCGMVAAS
eukprot:TRINITY_DN62220_c0_g1_i1.p1 TRINITY_DN62220_c0_g1~~TRINITY_DN62220_c0_g1_i1.p1  ORF type:complete len:506 (-),score=124.78 TRINITY_DN62220_c0_g1_i1:295-1812(-)